MPSARTARRLAALVGIGAASLAPLPAAALADSGTSAGDQQYVDPLGGSSTPAASHPSSPSSSSSPGSSATPVASSSGSGSSTPAGVANSAVASGATGTTSARTLPFTGYDGGLAVALGGGLVAGGVLLRRRLVTTDR